MHRVHNATANLFIRIELFKRTTILSGRQHRDPKMDTALNLHRRMYNRSRPFRYHREFGRFSYYYRKGNSLGVDS